MPGLRVVAGLAVALLVTPAYAHGLGTRHLDDARATVVEFYYTDGTVMAYGEARAFAPDAPQVPFANGRADQLGRFAFVPDKPGVWRVEGKDGEGHQVATTVEVAPSAATASKWRQPVTWMLLASAALNLALLMAWAERRRKTHEGAPTRTIMAGSKV